MSHVGGRHSLSAESHCCNVSLALARGLRGRISSYYYLRTLSTEGWRPWRWEHLERVSWVMVVEYMDRSRGPTVDFFILNLPVTLP